MKDKAARNVSKLLETPINAKVSECSDEDMPFERSNQKQTKEEVEDKPLTKDVLSDEQQTKDVYAGNEPEKDNESFKEKKESVEVVTEHADEQPIKSKSTTNQSE